MAFSLCNLQPLAAFRFQKENLPQKIPSFSTRFSQENTQFSVFNSGKRLRYLAPFQAVSVNGYSSRKEENESFEKIQEIDKLSRWIEFLREIFPGGEWWRLSREGSEDVYSAKPVTVLRALKKMWELVSHDRWLIVGAFVALIVTAVSEISIPHYLTASVFSAQSSTIALFHHNVRLLVILCISAAICSGLRGFLFSIANMILVRRLRERLYSTLLHQDISFFDSETVGDLTSRLGSDCQQVSRIIGNDLNLISRNVLQGIGALVYLLILSLPLGLCVFAICISLSTILMTYGQYQKKSAKLIQECTASANQVAQETFSLIRTVRVYGTELPELGRYEHWLDKLAGITLRQSAAYGVWSFSFNSLYHSSQVIAVIVGGVSILNGYLTPEKLTKFILYSEWLIYSTWWIGDNISSMMQSIGASEKVFHLIDLPVSNQFNIKGLELQDLSGQVEFVNVSFRYPSRAEIPVLQNFSLAVHPGEVVAIVGLSGSGKSSLVNLLLRLYEPTDGEILVDGYPLKELNIKWLREKVGYVGQEPRLFRMDISSNIRYGCPQDVSDSDVEMAAKQAFAHDFICSLPKGYQTLVDDDLLSGGQKQRIAIARALLRDTNILILDEATSALDAESEHNIKGILRAARGDRKTKRTVFVIAHRLSTVKSADRIIVMDGGKIVETGSHAELLTRKGGLYAHLVRRQADAVV